MKVYIKLTYDNESFIFVNIVANVLVAVFLLQPELLPPFLNIDKQVKHFTGMNKSFQFVKLKF